ncbi:MAG: cyclic nucleotide-binding domain-containing protein [Candidatus Sulfotelmatobacter sp.]
MAGNRLRYLTADDWVLIQAKAVRRAFKLGEEIIRQGDWGGSIYIIRRGEASVELAGTGSRAIVATLGPEDICGDMAFLEQGKADCSRSCERSRRRSRRNQGQRPAGNPGSFPQARLPLLPVRGVGPRAEAEGHYRGTGP